MVGSFTTTTFHPWRFPPLGAKRASSRMSWSTASDTGSSVNSRTAAVVRMTSLRSIPTSPRPSVPCRWSPRPSVPCRWLHLVPRFPVAMVTSSLGSMSSTYSGHDVAVLLEPLALGSRTAPNRIVFGPHETNLGRGRSFSERHVAYYRRRAAGGAGIIVTEEASVHPSDWPYERAPWPPTAGPAGPPSPKRSTPTGRSCWRDWVIRVARAPRTGVSGSSGRRHACPRSTPVRFPSGWRTATSPR